MDHPVGPGGWITIVLHSIAPVFLRSEQEIVTTATVQPYDSSRFDPIRHGREFCLPRRPYREFCPPRYHCGQRQGLAG